MPLLDRLPPVRGRYQADAPLGARTWFACGGTAEALFRPADIADLQAFLQGRPRDVPYTVLGAGSNVLVRDGGVQGVVIRLGGPFAAVTVDDTTLTAGAAALDLNVALAAAEAGVGGLEFLSGIPGTIGGAVAMNAGAYGAEIRDVLVSADVLDPDGRLHTLSADDLGFSYRHSQLPPGWSVVGAVLRGTPAPAEAIHTRIAEIRAAREASQPVKGKTGGSTFTNPPGHKAWELIDAAGCRGLQLGGAQVSEKHCNFLINTGTATATELEALGEEVRRRVREHSGVTLEWEIKRLGRATTQCSSLIYSK
jgi:UDP-N-acetylmuramate dehydrogenase